MEITLPIRKGVDHTPWRCFPPRHNRSHTYRDLRQILCSYIVLGVSVSFFIQRICLYV